MDCSCPQAPLSIGFSRQEYWSGWPFPSRGDLPDPGMEPSYPALAGWFFTAEPLGKPTKMVFSSVQLLSRVRLFVTPWTTAHQASLSLSSSSGLKSSQFLVYFFLMQRCNNLPILCFFKMLHQLHKLIPLAKYLEANTFSTRCIYYLNAHVERNHIFSWKTWLKKPVLQRAHDQFLSRFNSSLTAWRISWSKWQIILLKISSGIIIIVSFQTCSHSTPS